MLAARKRAGLTQHEVARRMKTQRTSVSRAEAGRTRATIDYLERFARALGTPMTITFGGPSPPTDVERWERARRNLPFLGYRNGILFPATARGIGLTDDEPFDATAAYRFAVAFIAHSGEEQDGWGWRPSDLSWPGAIASIWYDEIDWSSIADQIRSDRKAWRTDIMVRKKARHVIAERGP